MNMEKEVLILNIEDILPNRFQPRIKFKEENINELAESIKEHGVIQPIVVRKISDKYEIIAGERRYKASILAGKTTIPAIITDLDDKDSAEVALIENVQRQNLTPIEEAISYKKILDMGYINQTDLAEKLGKTQSTIANKLRLLNLDEEVQESLLNERISERHARSLLKLEKSKQVEMLNRIINERMTVRKTDEEISKILNNSQTDSNSEISPIIQEEKPQFNQVEQNSEIEILNLEEETPTEDLEKTMELPKINIEKEINNMNNNQFNIPSEPIIDSNQNGSMNNQAMNNQTMNINSQPISTENANNYVENNNINTMNSQEQTPVYQNIQPQAPITPEVSQSVTSPQIDTSTVSNEPVLMNGQTNVNQIPNLNNIEGNNSEENNSTSGSTGGKFFNMFDMNQMAPQDIESKQANMNFEENNSTPSNPFNLNFNPVQNQEVSNLENNNQNNMNSIEDPFENKLNPYSLNDDQQFTNVNQISPQNPTIPSEVSQVSPTIENTIINNPTSNTEMINPNQMNNQNNQQGKFVTGNLRMVINTIRDCASTIEKYGFHIETEELDFENMYQVTFKIDKNN